MEFTEDTNLETLLESEKAQEVLAEHEVPCLGCPMAKLEMQDLTLGQICEQYDLDLEKILTKLNQLDE